MPNSCRDVRNLIAFTLLDAIWTLEGKVQHLKSATL
jgi:hypothetical protein